MIKFIKYTLLVYLISLILLYTLAKLKDELILIFAFFGIVYAPICGVILYIISNKYKFSTPKFFVLSLLVTIISFILGITIVFSFF